MASTVALIGKAARAARSAALLLESGDTDGACNRTCYAMFDGARAAPLATGSDQASIRARSGSIAAFGLRLVKSGRIDRSLGHILNRTHEIRLIADYTGDLVNRELATWAVEQPTQLVDAIRAFMEAPR